MEHYVYHQKDFVTEPCVLFCDYNGWWATLSNLYLSKSSKKLVSRHPESCIEEVISYYCSQCMTVFGKDEAHANKYKCSSCFQCPECLTILCASRLSNGLLALQCGMCFWRSDICNLFAESETSFGSIIASLNQNRIGKDAFAKLLSINCGYNSLSLPDSMTTYSKNNDHEEFKWYDAEKMQNDNVLKLNIKSIAESSTNPLESFCNELSEHDMTKLVSECDSQSLLSNPSQRSLGSLHSMLSKNVLPCGVSLGTKKTIRSRKDVNEGKKSVLYQSKVNPLDGDTSHIQQGKWWVKESYALQSVPMVIVTKYPPVRDILSSSNSSTGAWLHLNICSYRDTDTIVFVRLNCLNGNIYILLSSIICFYYFISFIIYLTQMLFVLHVSRTYTSLTQSLRL